MDYKKKDDQATLTNKADYVKRQEAADMLGIPYNWLLQYERNGVITPYRVGRLFYYKKADVEALKDPAAMIGGSDDEPAL